MKFLSKIRRIFRSEIGQHTAEYIILLTLVMAGIMIMGPYVIRSWNANLKGWDDSVMDSFHDPLASGTQSLPACGGTTSTNCPSQDYSTTLCGVMTLSSTAPGTTAQMNCPGGCTGGVTGTCDSCGNWTNIGDTCVPLTPGCPGPHAYGEGTTLLCTYDFDIAEGATVTGVCADPNSSGSCTATCLNGTVQWTNSCTWCGDGTCDSGFGENSCNCQDCKANSYEASCGNECCEVWANESPNNCQEDCGPPTCDPNVSVNCSELGKSECCGSNLPACGKCVWLTQSTECGVDKTDCCRSFQSRQGCKDRITGAKSCPCCPDGGGLAFCQGTNTPCCPGFDNGVCENPGDCGLP